MGVFNALRANAVRSKSMSRLDGVSGLPGDIPHGCLAVYVGEERRRYVIRAQYLNHELFKDLLKKGEEEYGFHYQGGLFIPCDTSFFEQVLAMVGHSSQHMESKSGRMKDLAGVHGAMHHHYFMPEAPGKFRKVQSALQL